MNNREVIEWLRKKAETVPMPGARKMYEAAAKAISCTHENDLISRQDTIDAICTWDKFGVDERGRIVSWYEGLEPYVHLRDVLTAIVNLPAAQQWIPCSEKLPKEEKKTYWVCTDTEYQCECRWTNNRFGLGEGEWGWSIFDTPQYSKPIAWMPLPVAWMPLPEPWKGEEDKVTERTGRWTHVYDENEKLFFKNQWVCSACGKSNTYGMSDFCPCCGAMMENSTRRMKEAKK